MNEESRASNPSRLADSDRFYWRIIILAAVFLCIAAQQAAPAAEKARKVPGGERVARIVGLTEAKIGAWRDRLRDAPADSRWFVGFKFGRELSRLPGESAFEILVRSGPTFQWAWGGKS